MKVVLSKKAEKDIKSLEKFVAIHVVKKIREFADKEKGDIKKIKGKEYYRLRVGDYRVLFEYVDKKVNILRVKHRSQIY